MIDSPQMREECAAKLSAAAGQTSQLSAFIGLDGFVDEIVHIVDKRESAESFTRLPTITSLAERIAGAAGKSTNLELVSSLTKLGGNGPIMANALASFGLRVSYLGLLGHPQLHTVFEDFAKRAEVHSIGEPGYTLALEFDDGKLMFGKHSSLKEMNWANIQSRFGRDKFAAKFGSSDLVGFVNWTMLPYMSDIWDELQQDLCLGLQEPRRKLFLDLADPEKRTLNDISRALDLIVRFNQHFDVILGLNEKEAFEIGKVLNVAPKPRNPEGLAGLAVEIHRRVPIHTLVVHPVTYAVAVTAGKASMVQGPHIPKPKITTGAGDHFNAGFCLGKLLGFEDAQAVLMGVGTSGYYVRSALSPSVNDLVGMLRDWPGK
jgi:sugar/nucleoside kinase (ribokinase family)